MTYWRKRGDLGLAAGVTQSLETGPEPKRMPMRQSVPIEIDGVFLGAAVEHELGIRFVAVDVRVADMNHSVWPNVDYARMSARQMFRSNRTFGES